MSKTTVKEEKSIEWEKEDGKDRSKSNVISITEHRHAEQIHTESFRTEIEIKPPDAKPATIIYITSRYDTPHRANGPQAKAA